MNRPIHLELRSLDVRQTREFWSKVFGWMFVKHPGPVDYWGVSTGADDTPGIHGGLMTPRDGQVRCVPWIEVADVEASAADIVNAGGVITVPKMPVPGVGDLAYCAAPDGIAFAIVRCSTGK